MKNNYRLFAILSILSLATLACGITRTTPTAVSSDEDQTVQVTEIRQMGTFTKIDMDGGGSVNLVQGNDHSVKVEGSRRVVDQVTTEVQNGVLVIDYRDKSLIDLWSEDLTLTITFVQLSEFKLDGGVELKANDLNLENLSLDVKGGANVALKNLQVQNLDISMIGGGNIEVSGNADNQNVEVAGGTNYIADDLKSAHVTVKVTGAANVEVWATESLSLDLAGAYSVKYWGSPSLDQNIRGLGNVEDMGEK